MGVGSRSNRERADGRHNLGAQLATETPRRECERRLRPPGRDRVAYVGRPGPIYVGNQVKRARSGGGERSIFATDLQLVARLKRCNWIENLEEEILFHSSSNARQFAQVLHICEREISRRRQVGPSEHDGRKFKVVSLKTRRPVGPNETRLATFRAGGPQLLPISSV